MNALGQNSPDHNERKSRYKIWQNRDFALLWSGQAMSNAGSAISGVAFPLLVLSLTNSPAQAGFVGALGAIPYLVTSLPAGVLIDRWNRKRLMALCDLIRCLNLAAIALALSLSKLVVAQLYAASLIEGTLYTLFNISQVASLSRVVDRDQVAEAYALNQLAGRTSTLLGPSIGGFLYGVQRFLPFIVDSLSYLISSISILYVRSDLQSERTLPSKPFIREIGDGFFWLWHNPLLRFQAILGGGLNFVLSANPLLVVLLAKQQHASPAQIGLIFSLGGLGGICGSMVSRRIQRSLTFTQAMLGLLWLLPGVWALYMVSSSYLFLGIVSAGLSFVDPILSVVNVGYRLALTPDELQGRVNSVHRFFSFGLRPLGSGLLGIMWQFYGPKPTIVFFNIVLILLASSASLNRHVRNAPQL